MVRVNVLGVYHMARSVRPVMIDRKKGVIVNIASVAGLKYSTNFALIFSMRSPRGVLSCRQIRAIG